MGSVDGTHDRAPEVRREQPVGTRNVAMRARDSERAVRSSAIVFKVGVTRIS